jgi:hypothetical protein
LEEHLSYLEKREGQVQYPAYLAAGWPIGSGMVESANKLLVEEWLKGSGMHWARSHVNPLVALRTIAFNDRWDEAWPQVTIVLRRQAWQRRLQRQQARRARRMRTPTSQAASATMPQPPNLMPCPYPEHLSARNRLAPGVRRQTTPDATPPWVKPAASLGNPISPQNPDAHPKEQGTERFDKPSEL